MSKHSVYATIFANAAALVQARGWRKSSERSYSHYTFGLDAVGAVSRALTDLYRNTTLSKDDHEIVAKSSTVDVLTFGWGKATPFLTTPLPKDIVKFVDGWNDHGANQQSVVRWLQDTANVLQDAEPKGEYPNCWLVIPGGYRYPAALCPSSLDINSGNKYVFEHPTNGKVITAERVGYAFYAISDNAGGYSTYGSSVDTIDAFKRFCGFAPNTKSQGADVAGAQPAKNDSQPQYGYEVFIPGCAWAAFVDSITGLPFPPITWTELPTTEPVHHSEGNSPLLLRNIVENGSEVVWTDGNRKEVKLAYAKNDRPYYAVTVIDGFSKKSSRFGEDDGAPVDAWREARQFYLDTVEKLKTK